VEKKKKSGGFEYSVTQMNSSTGIWFKDLVKGKPRGLGVNMFFFKPFKHYSFKCRQSLQNS
jgi:hypothetical protein